MFHATMTGFSLCQFQEIGGICPMSLIPIPIPDDVKILMLVLFQTDWMRFFTIFV